MAFQLSLRIVHTGASHGQELGARQMEAVIRAAGRVPVQRTTLYGRAPGSQVLRSLEEGREALKPLTFEGPRRTDLLA